MCPVMALRLPGFHRAFPKQAILKENEKFHLEDTNFVLKLHPLYTFRITFATDVPMVPQM